MSVSLAVKNCARRPGRTTALVLLSMLLSMIVLLGSLTVTGLRSGLGSLQARLGADIMVVPYKAVTQSKLDDMILQGNPGYFYMNNSVVDKIAAMDGIGEMSEQFYLATASSSCCSYKVQLIGFDPETDFTITPWVELSYRDTLGDMEVLVGCQLNAFAGDTLTFYGTDVKVAARLEETGTYLDTAVYANTETVKVLIAHAKEAQIFDFGDVNPDEIVSSILINVADGYSVEEVLNDINIHVRGVEAVRTQNMVADVSGKIGEISSLGGILILAVWLLVVGILMLTFAMISNERRKEFAVLRVMGASRGRLAAELMKESLLTCGVGSITGALLGQLLARLFRYNIESALNMPFLLPSFSGMALLTLLAVAVSVLAGAVSAAVSAYRISRIDAAVILRGEN